MNIVRVNLLTLEGYTPYCGNPDCIGGMPRTHFNGSQFKCRCGWVSEFPEEFIKEYKQKWGLE